MKSFLFSHLSWNIPIISTFSLIYQKIFYIVSETSLENLQGWRFCHTSLCALGRNVQSKSLNFQLGVVVPYIACHNQEEHACKSPSSSFRLLWVYLPFNLLFSKLNKPSSLNHSSQLVCSGPWLTSALLDPLQLAGILLKGAVKSQTLPFQATLQEVTCSEGTKENLLNVPDTTCSVTAYWRNAALGLGRIDFRTWKTQN